MAGPILHRLRMLRLRLWTSELRLRLRRQGVRLDLDVGEDVRFAGRPRLDVDTHDARASGSVLLRIGAHARVGRDLILDVRPGGENVVELGEGCRLGDHVRLQLRGGTIRVGDHANVRDFCELKSSGELTVGARAVLARNATLHCVERVSIGALCAIAERVTVTDSDHGTDGSDTWSLGQPLRVEPVELRDNVFVGTNAVLLRGVRLGANVVVAAGAVVRAGEVPAGWLVAGVPAKAVKALGDVETTAP